MADWLEFNGVLSTDLGVYMAEPPSVTVAAERVHAEQVPGRDGDLEISDDAYDPIALSVLCYCRDLSRLDEIAGWLRGRGWLRLGNRPGERYKARAVTQVQFDTLVRGRENRTFEVLFDCQPHRYVYPEAADIEPATSGTVVTNPGNTWSAPKIRVEGTGDVRVTVGTQLIELQGLLDGAVVDSEFMDVLNLTESAFLNDLAVIDEFPRLEHGPNIITWSGTVSKITITPRWRNI